MIFRVAFVAALLAALLTACTVQRFPGDCGEATASTYRTKNRTLIHSSTLTTLPPLALSC